MHITSLPSPYGIGTMGGCAREFADFLESAGQSRWQILPIGPVSFGDSPYQSFSTFAGNPYLIDLDDLARDGLLRRSEFAETDWGDDPSSVDYALMYRKRFPVLRFAVARLLSGRHDEYDIFVRENSDWLPDYALFMALKDEHGGKPWWEWEHGLRVRDKDALKIAADRLEDDIAFWQGAQYLFFRQYRALKAYANLRGIGIIGDLPIYVAGDSVDVWMHPGRFLLDGNLRPVEVSGCPPDPFSPDGQLWGNPVYNWDVMEKDGFSWWIRRFAWQNSLFDTLRIDHFRGFDSYYAVPFGEETARNGSWRKAPGMKLFRVIEDALGHPDIIAEDLGFLTDSVRQLLKDTGYPGIKVLEFAFDAGEDGEYLPHNYGRHCVAYVGTHDNDTALGWLHSIPSECRERAVDYLKLTREEGYSRGMLRAVLASPADTAILQAQDLLGLGSEGRMNTPSTVGINWKWRARPGDFSPGLATWLRHETELYGRLPDRFI